MSRKRAWWVGALAVMIVGGLGGAAYAVWGTGPDYGHELVGYGSAHGQKNRVVDLPGRAQLAIGSPDRHRIVVQWRDPDGHGWTSPRTVWTEKRLRTIEIGVRSGSGTVGIVEAFHGDDGDEDDSFDKYTGIVCRDVSCTAQRVPSIGGTPRVTPDGRTVLLSDDETGPVIWTASKGIHALRWSHHPAVDDKTTPSGAVLAADGSLRVVSGADVTSACRYTLLTTPPDSADLTPVASMSVPLRGGREPRCGSGFGTATADLVAVLPASPRARDFWFVRHAGTWTATFDDPTGIRALARGSDCCSTVFATVRGGELAVGSPDGRHVELQSRLTGQELWSKPVLVAGVPAGYDCNFPDPLLVGANGTVVLMACHPGSGRQAVPVDGTDYALAVSADLAHWQSRFVEDVTDPPNTNLGGPRDRIVVGDTTWSPEAGFSTR